LPYSRSRVAAGDRAEDNFGVRHNDGNGWTIYEQPTATLLWERAPNDVWGLTAATAGSVSTYQLVHWDGSVWHQIPIPSADGFVPYGIWSRSPTAVYLAGNAGRLLRWNGTQFEILACAGVNGWSAVWGDATSVWTVGEGGAVARWQGDSCKLFSTEALLGGVRHLTDIWGSGPDNLWIVGQQGSVLRWNGQALVAEPSGLSDDLSAVWGHVSGVVWAVGNNQTVLRRTF